MRLEALTAAEVAEQVVAILATPASDDMVDRIVERSEGNPFFVEELLAGGEAGSAAAIPPSLRGILAQRLDALPASAAPVVRAAAVLGRIVRHDLLARVTGLAEPVLLEALRAATDDHVVVPMPDARPSYAFRHALVREVAYRAAPAH